MEFQLSQEKIEFYKENGFVQVDQIINEKELAELRAFMDEMMYNEDQLSSIQTDKQGGAYYKVLNQRINTWRDHAGMAKYTTHPRFAEIALQLTGASGIRLFHDHALLKMPGDSKPTPWHQDLTYWPMNEPGALSIWIALDDVDEHNGCMQFIPRSRSLGKLSPIDLVNPQNIFEFTNDKTIASQKPVIVRMKAGSCTFHDGLTFHYAHANMTGKPRRALAIIYMQDGVTYSKQPHIITDTLQLVKDAPIHGGFFPILASSAR